MLPSQVGTIPDIISGQINIFQGTNPNANPTPETAETTTFGFVWEPEFFDFLTATTISVDYYDITILDYIDTPTGQESLDLCYVLADPVICGGIVRIGGALGETGTGTPAFFTNFVAFQAEGVDLVINTGFDAGNIGEFGVAFTRHQYLTNEFQTTAASAVVDCKGVYGTSCDPVPEIRHTLRINWFREQFDASLLWRFIGSMEAQANEEAALFDAFRHVESQDYFDLTFGFEYKDFGRISLLVRNVADEDPPIMGNETGSTSFNSGNTFPSLYDTLGRTYFVNLKFTF
jgi:outer membrane receptor protein involved in Fe transport